MIINGKTYATWTDYWASQGMVWTGDQLIDRDGKAILTYRTLTESEAESFRAMIEDKSAVCTNQQIDTLLAELTALETPDIEMVSEAIDRFFLPEFAERIMKRYEALPTLLAHIAELTREREKLTIQASKYAYERDLARRERDKAEFERDQLKGYNP